MIIRKPKSSIRYIKILENPSKELIEAIHAREAPHGICNGTFFESPFNPCANTLWVDGVKKSDGRFPGFALGNSLTWGSHTASYAGDFIGGYPSFENGILKPSDVNSDVGAETKRQRAVLAETSNELIYYASLSASFADVSSELNAAGVTRGANLDGGASLKYIFGQTKYIAKQGDGTERPVPNFIMFWFKDEPMPTRKLGDKGFLVREIQRLLTAKGFAVTVTGNYEASTQVKVKAFQLDRGLSNADGIVDVVTWAGLLN